MTDRYLGIEIGGTKLQLVAGDQHATILHRRRLPVRPELGAQAIRDQIAAALPSWLKEFRPRSVGIGFGGPVDRGSGNIGCSHQIPGWSGFPMVEWVESLAGVPVAVENDANTAALAEALNGAGRGVSPVFYVTLGSGVGGGLVEEGRIYHGASPGESEIGHLRLDRQGTLLESCCSGWAIDRKVRELARSNRQSVLASLLGKDRGGEARHLRAALEKGEPLARRILAEFARDFSFGLSHVVHLMHPQMIVLGGGLSLIGEPLRAAVEEALPAGLMDVFRPGPSIRIAALGEDVVPVGALLLAHTRGVPDRMG